jgi:hypothetical protein
MKNFLTVFLVTIFSYSFSQQTFYDVTYGNGNGIRFWQNNNNDGTYKIHMGSGAEYFYGPVTDYSIKTNMSNNPGRGWVWGVAGNTPVAAINTLGQMQIAGGFTVGGDIVLPTISGNKQIFTYSATDMNWRIGMSSSPGFGRSLTTSYVQYLTYYNSPGHGFAVGVNGGNSSFEIQGSDHAAFFRGNVGIGVASSSSALTVRGAATAEETVVNVSNLSDQDFAVRLSAVGAAAKRTIIGPSTPTRLSLGVGVTSGNEYLTVVNGGNVGIGTTSPNQKLTVNGTIYGKEVKVDLSVPGPDYVFEKDYKLPSLDEIKSYIDQHKHLPEVPSAKEMEQNGINLSEMNMILLRKIEELTLHVIEQNKQISKLKEERNPSPDLSGKKVEELTLIMIELKSNNKLLEDENRLIKNTFEERIQRLENEIKK